MNTEWIAAAARLQAQQQPFALVSVLRVQPPASAKAGDKALVTADGAIHGWIGGGCAQPAVIKTVRAALADGQPRTIRITPTEETAERTLGDVLEFGMACHSGGTLELFIDPVLPAAHLTVLGDSPVARALSVLAPRVGFTVAVVAEGATAPDFPDAQTVLPSDDAASVCAALPAAGFAVVATQGRRDLQGLKAALALQPRALWFVASARKAGVLKQSLLASGEDPARVAAIAAPAGEPIGAQTAEEIALTVLVAVVAARRAPLAAAAPVAVAGPDTEAVAPTAAKSCCGGAAKKAAAPAKVEAPVEPAVTAVPKKSCCGG
ncbi:MAG: XdhC family protein [Hydrogenophaga sp.]|uniref:XdhC family protein n=1 Tax=Hydrogenophaga sp. TaxID=1904254 RepID=UPI002733AE5A|nr:XdhC family protein [Hydrogenophaga sp.]MDP3344224.1 XdhC family protein [Hydrogenophaga sp.]MDP3807416.1 XdhC family protein [Hydrogenophaga sp.]MDP3925017.1 XdhC family protein [Hydrogenophaga sp.]